MAREYNREIPNYGDVFTIERWKNTVESGMITNWDGSGYWGKNGMMSHEDEVFSSFQEDATHVVWFNK